jgi:hypothetical protein
MEIRELIQNKRGQKFFELLFEQEVIDHALRQPITMDPQLNVITLGVRDFTRSLASFRDGPGWTARWDDDIDFFLSTVYPGPLRGPAFRVFPLPVMPGMRMRWMGKRYRFPRGETVQKPSGGIRRIFCGS